MSFGENLQFLRKRAGMTQEELAERLEVTRQSVSKWEGNSAYPEMAALLRLCELFGVDLDTLVRGDAQAALAEDSAGYDAHMNAFSKAVAGAVGLILLGVAVMVLLATFDPSDAVAVIGVCVLLGCIAVAVAVLIAFGMGHSRFMKTHPVVRPFYTQEEIDRFERRYPLLIALPVALILIGVICQIAVTLLPELRDSPTGRGLGAGVMLPPGTGSHPGGKAAGRNHWRGLGLRHGAGHGYLCGPGPCRRSVGPGGGDLPRGGAGPRGRHHLPPPPGGRLSRPAQTNIRQSPLFPCDFGFGGVY